MWERSGSVLALHTAKPGSNPTGILNKDSLILTLYVEGGNVIWPQQLVHRKAPRLTDCSNEFRKKPHLVPLQSPCTIFRKMLLSCPVSSETGMESFHPVPWFKSRFLFHVSSPVSLYTIENPLQRTVSTLFTHCCQQPKVPDLLIFLFWRRGKILTLPCRS